MKKSIMRFTEGPAPVAGADVTWYRDRRDGAYPRAVKADDWIFMTLGMAGATFEEQLVGIFEEIKSVLESYGSSMWDIVSMTVYFVDLKGDRAKALEIWPKYIPSDNHPVAAWIGIKELWRPHMLVEVTCTAICQSP